jgi:hypothetical protein
MAKAHKAAGQPLCTASLPEGRGTWMCRVSPSPSAKMKVICQLTAPSYS